jgi:hypothetical protein
LKLYLCVNDKSLDNYADDLRVAINSAIWIAKLEPHVLFDGAPERLRGVVGHGDFVIHSCHSAILDKISATPATDGWHPHVAEGALLRLEIPLIEKDDEFVMYTDCDVIFTRKVDYRSIRPKFIGAAPGHNPCNWEDICSGVMILNAPNLRKEYRNYMDVAARNLGVPHFYDQEVLNCYFKGRFDRIPLEYHWKVYWEPNPLARIVHFHGLKRRQIELLRNRSPGDEDVLPWTKPLFVQRSGADYYADIYDGVDKAELKSASDIIWRKAPEVARFFWKKLAGYGRRLRPTTPDPRFDEDFYLYANPDVAIALHIGTIPSGWRHYDAYGRKEGRAARFHPHAGD